MFTNCLWSSMQILCSFTNYHITLYSDMKLVSVCSRMERARADSCSPQTTLGNGLRERCYSLGGDTLPTLPRGRRERQISCSSQTDSAHHDDTFLGKKCLSTRVIQKVTNFCASRPVQTPIHYDLLCI